MWACQQAGAVHKIVIFFFFLLFSLIFVSESLCPRKFLLIAPLFVDNIHCPCARDFLLCLVLVIKKKTDMGQFDVDRLKHNYESCEIFEIFIVCLRVFLPYNSSRRLRVLGKKYIKRLFDSKYHVLHEAPKPNLKVMYL